MVECLRVLPTIKSGRLIRPSGWAVVLSGMGFWLTHKAIGKMG